MSQIDPFHFKFSQKNVWVPNVPVLIPFGAIELIVLNSRCYNILHKRFSLLFTSLFKRSGHKKKSVVISKCPTSPPPLAVSNDFSQQPTKQKTGEKTSALDPPMKSTETSRSSDQCSCTSSASQLLQHCLTSPNVICVSVLCTFDGIFSKSRQDEKTRLGVNLNYMPALAPCNFWWWCCLPTMSVLKPPSPSFGSNRHPKWIVGLWLHCRIIPSLPDYLDKDAWSCMKWWMSLSWRQQMRWSVTRFLGWCQHSRILVTMMIICHTSLYLKLSMCRTCHGSLFSSSMIPSIDRL